MNRKLLHILVVGAAAAIAITSFALACGDKSGDANKTSASAASATGHATCSAAQAAQCTAAQAAACKAKRMAAAASGECPMHAGATAVDAVVNSSNCPAHASGGCPFMGETKSAATASACSAHATATSASASGCSAHAKATSASASGCSAHAKDASAAASCGAHGAAAKSATAFPAGGHACGSKGASAMTGNYDGISCDACADRAWCNDELKAAQAQSQIVQLKNGVMYVYTATNPQSVRAIQAAIARRNARMNEILTAEDAKLCPNCRALRGATASGKLNREVINIEGGCINLVTTDDPGIVTRLYDMAGLPGGKTAKS